MSAADCTGARSVIVRLRAWHEDIYEIARPLRIRPAPCVWEEGFAAVCPPREVAKGSLGVLAVKQATPGASANGREDGDDKAENARHFVRRRPAALTKVGWCLRC